MENRDENDWSQLEHLKSIVGNDHLYGCENKFSSSGIDMTIANCVKAQDAKLKGPKLIIQPASYRIIAFNGSFLLFQ